LLKVLIYFFKENNFKQFSKNYLTAKTVDIRMLNYFLFCQLLPLFYRQAKY